MDTQEAGSSLTDNAPPSAAPRSKANHTDGSHDWPHSHGSSGSHSSEAEATEAATLAAQQGGTAGQAAAAAAAAARNSAEGVNALALSAVVFKPMLTTSDDTL